MSQRRVPLPDLEGSRLVLRPATVDDLDFFTGLNSDTEVMRHTTGSASSRLETEREWARRLGPRSDESRGLGYWLGLVDREPIGWWGLGSTHGDAEAGELGFRLPRRHWQHGFGSEGARVVVAHGFSSAGLARVWAGTVRANEASRATLGKVGLQPTDEPAPGVLTYEITREAWLRIAR